jgi:hypothetical protein
MTPLRARELAVGAQDWELCYVAITGKGGPVLRDAVNVVMGERRTDCRQHLGMVQTKIAADGAASARSQTDLQQAMILLQAAQPKPAPGTKPVYCRTVYVGGGYNTVCD